jgi:hypothetical protein
MLCDYILKFFKLQLCIFDIDDNEDYFISKVPHIICKLLHEEENSIQSKIKFYRFHKSVTFNFILL